MSISEIVCKLLQFNKTERVVFVKLYTRDGDGNVIGIREYPVEAVFSHYNDCAVIHIEQSEGRHITP